MADINRARVLRVRSIMRKGQADGRPYEGDVDHNDNLESVIALSGGDTTKAYRVMRDGRPVGYLDMRELVRALVPARAPDEGVRSRLSA